jgi:peptidoglycan/LPS O-acetylase OafA/YrhL
MVVVAHYYGDQLSTLVSSIYLWPMQVFWDAADAVAIFFLLSGYVLARQLLFGSVNSYFGFVVRRFFRIWPPFAVAVTLAAALFGIIGRYVALTPVDPPLLNPSVSAYSLMANLLMSTDEYTIDPPVWSLYVEMRISVFFPIIMFLVLRTRLMTAIVVGTAYSIAASRLTHSGLGIFVTSFADTSKFVFLFVAGAALAIPENEAFRLFDNLSTWGKAGFVSLGLCLLMYRFFPLPLPASNYVPTIGAAILFLVCLRTQIADKVLTRSLPLFLGRISYGLYLVHYFVLVLIIGISSKYVPHCVAAAAALAISIALAWIINVYIERPTTQFGRHLSKRYEYGKKKL